MRDIRSPSSTPPVRRRRHPPSSRPAGPVARARGPPRHHRDDPGIPGRRRGRASGSAGRRPRLRHRRAADAGDQPRRDREGGGHRPRAGHRPVRLRLDMQRVRGIQRRPRRGLTPRSDLGVRPQQGGVRAASCSRSRGTDSGPPCCASAPSTACRSASASTWWSTCSPPRRWRPARSRCSAAASGGRSCTCGMGPRPSWLPARRRPPRSGAGCSTWAPTTENHTLAEIAEIISQVVPGVRVDDGTGDRAGGRLPRLFRRPSGPPPGSLPGAPWPTGSRRSPGDLARRGAGLHRLRATATTRP